MLCGLRQYDYFRTNNFLFRTNWIVYGECLPGLLWLLVYSNNTVTVMALPLPSCSLANLPSPRYTRGISPMVFARSLFGVCRGEEGLG
jgi:hypothetical protein